MHEAKNQPKETPVIEIDMSSARDTPEEARLIIRALKRNKLYKKGLLFSGFNGEEIEVVKEKGIYTRMTDL